MNFTAFDFETSSGRQACSLGVVRVKNGHITDSKHWLIKPPDMYFNPYNVAVHGISPSDVMREPEFDELWVEMSPFFEGQNIVAHNAPFDVGVLTHMLDFYQISYPNSSYFCTVMLGRKQWPDLPSHKLNVLASELGLRFRHHDALEDSVVCAKILMEIKKYQEDVCLNDIADKYGVIPGQLQAPDRLIKTTKKPKPKPVKSSITKADKEAITVLNNQLEEKNFVIGGIFKGFKDKELIHSIIENGGNLQSAVTKKTDYLLAGEKIPLTKMSKAKQNNIPVMTEEEYLLLIKQELKTSLR